MPTTYNWNKSKSLKSFTTNNGYDTLLGWCNGAVFADRGGRGGLRGGGGGGGRGLLILGGRGGGPPL